MFLRDDSKHIGGKRFAISANDYHHDGAALPHAPDNAKHDILLVGNGKVTAGNIVESNPGVRILEATADSGRFGSDLLVIGF